MDTPPRQTRSSSRRAPKTSSPKRAALVAKIRAGEEIADGNRQVALALARTELENFLNTKLVEDGATGQQLTYMKMDKKISKFFKDSKDRERATVINVAGNLAVHHW